MGCQLALLSYGSRLALAPIRGTLARRDRLGVVASAAHGRRATVAGRAHARPLVLGVDPPRSSRSSIRILLASSGAPSKFGDESRVSRVRFVMERFASSSNSTDFTAMSPSLRLDSLHFRRTRFERTRSYLATSPALGVQRQSMAASLYATAYG